MRLAGSSSRLLRQLGERLVSTDTLEAADALVLLAGEARSDRSDAAARLFKLGYAERLILCSNASSNTIMRERCIAKGVPATSIVHRSRQRQRWSTRSEARDAVQLLQEQACRSFILVTTDYHTARARRIFEKVLVGNGIEMMIHGSQDYYMSMDCWWCNRHGLNRIPKELAKYLTYRLIGF